MKYIGIIILVAIILYYVYQFMLVGKRNNKNQKYLDCVNVLDDEVLFNQMIDEFINNVNDEEFVVRAKVLKLYNKVMFKKYDEVQALLKEIDLTKLFREKEQYSKELLLLNEDSFFYYCFMSSFVLYQDNQIELINKFRDKLLQYDNELSEHLFYVLYKISLNIYSGEKTDYQFFDNLYSGSYKYVYPKQMIALYKKLASIIHTKLLVNENLVDKIEEVKKQEFNYNTNLFRRIISLLGLNEYLLNNVVEEKE